MATPTDLQAQVSAVQWTNGRGLISGLTLFGLFSLIITILNSMGTFGAGGFVPNIPAGTITAAMLAPGAGGGSVVLVPQRVVVSTGAISTMSTDFLVCLNGPTEVDLEASPAVGTTHILKDCRPSAGAPISVVPSGVTIDGAASYVMTVPAQSITVTFTSLGWSIY